MLSATPNHFWHQNSGLGCRVRGLQDVSKDDRVEDHLWDAQGGGPHERRGQFADEGEQEAKHFLHIADVGIQRPDESLMNKKYLLIIHWPPLNVITANVI